MTQTNNTPLTPSKGLSFLIPYYNKAHSISLLIEQVQFLDRAYHTQNTKAEFIFVDDGSTPEDAAALNDAFHKLQPNPQYKLIKHERNQGKGAALISAANAANYSQHIWLDADAAFESADVYHLAQKSLENPEHLIVGDRSQSKILGQHSLRTRLSKIFKRLAQHILGLRIKDIQTGLKAVPAAFFKTRTWNCTGFNLDIEVLRQARRDQLVILAFPLSTVHFRGQSSVNPLKSGFELLWELLGPLKSAPMLWGLLLVLVANLRAFSTRSSVPWDARDEMWFYFRWLGSASRNFEFGDFIPNIGSGYPIGANIQSGTYNPLYRFFAHIFYDSILSVNLLYLTLQLIIFVVVFLIGHSYALKNRSSFFLALSIIGSGFITGHASHFSYLSSAVGCLTVFLSFRFALRHHSYLSFTAGLLGVWHLGTTGYPAILLFGTQILGLYLIYNFISHKTARKELLISCVGALVGLTLSSPALLHFLNQLAQSARADGLSVQEVLWGSLPPRALLNFFIPSLYMQRDYPFAVDPSMDRFHLLFSSPFLIGFAIFYFKKISNGSRLKLFSWLGAGVFLSILAFGHHSPIPIREWLAENFFIFRVGRFPSGEHRGFALFCFAIVSAIGMNCLLGLVKIRRNLSRGILVLIALDFFVVMATTVQVRYMRLPKELHGQVIPFQIQYTTSDQQLIDAPRGCPFALQNEFDQRQTPPNRFSWNGYTNLFSKKYLDEREKLKEVFCSGPRLWDLSSQKSLPYRLIQYGPSRIVFEVDSTHISPSHEIVWADVNDGYWRITINSKATKFAAAPAGLMGIFGPNLGPAEGTHRVELSYHGPLTRLWR
jgi:glycosyltransferase involved in cell wall biosynthesis